MRLACVPLLAGAGGCGTTGPGLTAPSLAAITSASTTIGLSGQSNAVGLRDDLAMLAPVVGVQRNSAPIAAWDEGQPLWVALVDSLRGVPVRAFVWWQGESDADDPQYPRALEELLQRVRSIVGPVPIVLCGANANPAFARLRDEQQQYARTHPGVIYVPSDDLPRPGAGDLDIPTLTIWPGPPAESSHLTDAGYRQMAERILAALR